MATIDPESSVAGNLIDLILRPEAILRFSCRCGRSSIARPTCSGSAPPGLTPPLFVPLTFVIAWIILLAHG